MSHVLVEQLEKDTKDKGLELGLITFHQRILYWHSSGHSSSRAVGWEKAQNNSKNQQKAKFGHVSDRVKSQIKYDLLLLSYTHVNNVDVKLMKHLLLNALTYLELYV